MTWQQQRDADAEWRYVRDTAQKVSCDECNAAPGDTCINIANGKPLAGQPAHFKRISAAVDTPEGQG